MKVFLNGDVVNRLPTVKEVYPRKNEWSYRLTGLEPGEHEIRVPKTANRLGHSGAMTNVDGKLQAAGMVELPLQYDDYLYCPFFVQENGEISGEPFEARGVRYEFRSKYEYRYQARDRGWGDYGIVSTPVIHNDTIYVANGHDPIAEEVAPWQVNVRAISATDGKSLWNAPLRVGSKSSAVIKDGVCYIADFAGYLYAFDAKHGKLLWEHDCYAAVWGSPLVADGKVYIGDEDGDLEVLAAGRPYKPISEQNLGYPIYTTPTASNGVLFVTTINKLYAFAKK